MSKGRNSEDVSISSSTLASQRSHTPAGEKKREKFKRTASKEIWTTSP